MMGIKPLRARRRSEDIIVVDKDESLCNIVQKYRFSGQEEHE